MMDVNTIIQIINGCGFPIFACCALGYYIVWTKKQGIEQRKYDYESLKNAIDNNTAAVNALTELVKKNDQ